MNQEEITKKDIIEYVEKIKSASDDFIPNILMDVLKEIPDNVLIEMIDRNIMESYSRSNINPLPQIIRERLGKELHKDPPTNIHEDIIMGREFLQTICHISINFFDLSDESVLNITAMALKFPDDAASHLSIINGEITYIL